MFIKRCYILSLPPPCSTRKDPTQEGHHTNKHTVDDQRTHTLPQKISGFSRSPGFQNNMLHRKKGTFMFSSLHPLNSTLNVLQSARARHQHTSADRYTRTHARTNAWISFSMYPWVLTICRTRLDGQFVGYSKYQMHMSNETFHPTSTRT